MPEEKMTPEEEVKESIRYTKDGVELRSVAVAFLKNLNMKTIWYYGKKYYLGWPEAVVASIFLIDLFGPDYSGIFVNYLLDELGFGEFRWRIMVSAFLLLIILCLCSLVLTLLYRIGSALIRRYRNRASSRGGKYET